MDDTPSHKNGTPNVPSGRGGSRPGAGRPPKERPAAPVLTGVGATLAKRAALARRGSTLSLRDLAAAAGCSVPTVRAVLDGEADDPRLSTLRGMAKALGTSVGFLVGE